MVLVTDFGAIADGVTDCSSFIEKAIENASKIYFPEGVYLITKPIKIPSNKHLILDEKATIFACDGCFNTPNSRAVITNSDYENGNENIVFEGGKLDANNLGNARENWATGPNCGLSFSFQNVKNLTIKNCTVHNSEAYNVRLSRASDFLLDGLTFTATHYPHCQDGVHVSGFSHRGIIRNIKALGMSSNDDLIAFNADDDNTYRHNLGQENGPISDMLVENVQAENCWTGIRLLSIDNQISNVTIRNMTAGIRCHAVNLDAARYCANPLFTDKDRPDGVGKLRNITLENLTFYKTKDAFDASFCIFETKGDITVTNLKRDYSKDCFPDIPTVKFKNLPGHEITVNGNTYLSQGEKKIFDGAEFNIIIRG